MCVMTDLLAICIVVSRHMYGSEGQRKVFYSLYDCFASPLILSLLSLSIASRVRVGLLLLFSHCYPPSAALTSVEEALPREIFLSEFRPCARERGEEGREKEEAP